MALGAPPSRNKETQYRMDMTYWAPGGGDDGYGKPILAAPVQFLGHWSDKDQTFLNARGEQIVSRATIHYPAKMTIVADGWLCRGVHYELDPSVVPGAIIIRRTSEIPDIRNLEVIKMAMV